MDIRKVSIGPDLKSAIHYIVGQSVLNDTNKIHHIKHDGVEVLIYISNAKGEVVLWKRFGSTMPISIEYNIDF